MFQLIFSVVFLLLGLLFVGIGLLKGRKYTWVYSASRAGVVILSAVLSVLLSMTVARAVASAVYSMIFESGMMGDAADMLREIPSAPDVIGALIAILLAPLFFYLFFLILKAILNLVVRIVLKPIFRAKAKKASEQAAAEQAAAEIQDGTVVATETAEDGATETVVKVKVKKKRHSELRVSGVNPLGMVCGAACGLFLFIAIMAPVVGLFTVANTAVAPMAENSSEEILDTVGAVTDAAANNVGSKTVSVLGGKLLYSGLTTAKVGEHSISLMKETEFLGSIGGAAMAFSDENVSREDAAASIRKVEDAFSRSDLFPIVLPEFLHAASVSWDRGEDFFGVEKISLGENMEKLDESLLNVLRQSNYDTIKEDLGSIIHIMAILVEDDVFEVFEEDPMEILNREATIEAVLSELLLNDRMRPFVGDIAEVGLRMMADQMSIMENRDHLYEDFLKDATEMIANPANMEESVLEEEYSKLFGTYALDVSDDSITMLVSDSMTQFARRMAVNEEVVAAFLAAHTLTLNNGETFVPDSQESLSEVSLLVSLADIHFDSTMITDDEAAAEAKVLTVVLHEMMALTKDIEGNGFASAVVLRDMGAILDALSHTKTIGEDGTNKLIKGIFQAENVSGEVGFSVLDASRIADTLSKNAATDGYASMMVSLGDTIEIVQMSSNLENIEEKMTELLQDLTPNKVEVLQTMAKPSVMENHGVPRQSAQASSDMFSSLLGNLSDAKANGMSDEEYKKESQAATDITNLALKIGNSESSKVFGEDGATGISAEEYVNNIFESKVVVATVLDTVYEDGSDEATVDPLKAEKTLKDEEKGELIDALNNQWASASEEEKADPEYRKTYVALGALMNLELSVTDEGIVG